MSPCTQLPHNMKTVSPFSSIRATTNQKQLHFIQLSIFTCSQTARLGLSFTFLSRLGFPFNTVPLQLFSSEQRYRTFFAFIFLSAEFCLSYLLCTRPISSQFTLRLTNSSMAHIAIVQLANKEAFNFIEPIKCISIPLKLTLPRAP